MVTLVLKFVFVLSPPVILGIQFQQKPAEAVENAADFLLDAKVQADQLEALKKEVMDLVPRVNAGGFQARRYSIYLLPPCLATFRRDALSRLIYLASERVFAQVREFRVS